MILPQLLIGLLLAQPFTVNEAITVMNRIKQQYAELSRYSLDATYTLYRYDTGEAMDTLETRLIKQDSKLYQKTGATELIITNERKLFIDHRAQTALVQQGPTNWEPEAFLWQGYSTDYIGSASAIRLDVQLTTHTLVMQFQSGNYEEVAISYKPDTYELVSADMVLRETHPMVQFAGRGLLRMQCYLKRDHPVDASLFMPNRYYTTTATNTLKGVGKLAGYTIQLIPQP